MSSRHGAAMICTAIGSHGVHFLIEAMLVVIDKD